MAGPAVRNLGIFYYVVIYQN